MICLLFFGLSNIEPYTVTKDFKTAHCIVIRSNITGDRKCIEQATNKGDMKPGLSDNTSVSAQEVVQEMQSNATEAVSRSLPATYPCLKVMVNYTEKYLEAVDDSMEDQRPEYDRGPALLHDTHATWLKQQEEVAMGLHNNTVSTNSQQW